MHHIYRGLLGTVGTVAREDGASALWKGLEPGTMDASPNLRSFAAPKTCAAYDAACLHVSNAVLCPGLHRQCLFGGLRIGMYEPVKRVYMGDRPPGDAPLYLKVAAGLTTGALAIAIASPTDLVKVIGTFVTLCWPGGPSLPLHSTKDSKWISLRRKEKASCSGTSTYCNAAPGGCPHAWQASGIMWCFSAALTAL